MATQNNNTNVMMSHETIASNAPKRLVPELRFKEFNGDGFVKNIFEDIFLFTTGKNIKQNEASPEFEIPCVRYGELYHMYNEVIHEVVNKTNLDRRELKFSDGDEILLPSAGEDPLDIGSASALTIKNIAIGRTINILKPKYESVYSQIYASYYINQKLKRKIASLAKGVSISNVYNSDLKGLYIILPSLAEQKKIAQFLTAVESKLQQLNQKKELLSQYKKGVMQQLFSQQLRFRKDDGSDYPDWEEKRLGDFVKINQGLQISISKRYLEPVEGSYFYITNEFLKEKSEKKYFIKNPPNSVICKKDDILMTRTGNTGQVVTGVEGVFHNNFFRIKFNKSCIKDFLYYFLVLDKTQNTILRLAGTSTIPDLNHGDFYKLKISLPSIEEQQKIASYLSAIDSKIETVTQQIEATQQFKKGLLQQMFV
ncbi:restriction endonuclease subunit S [Winogradskyella pulchriflava]|uniref:Restriction endonuclease subunit S n=1 Tax=Winogradskyella pulchriflava TaxID=1110688 RepID=A0ABV6Q7Q3_9FLAO